MLFKTLGHLERQPSDFYWIKLLFISIFSMNYIFFDELHLYLICNRADSIETNLLTIKTFK